jgi:hypothetical protein
MQTDNQMDREWTDVPVARAGKGPWETGRRVGGTGDDSRLLFRAECDFASGKSPGDVLRVR